MTAVLDHNTFINTDLARVLNKMFCSSYNHQSFSVWAFTIVLVFESQSIFLLQNNWTIYFLCLFFYHDTIWDSLVFCCSQMSDPTPVNPHTCLIFSLKSSKLKKHKIIVVLILLISVSLTFTRCCSWLDSVCVSCCQSRDQICYNWEMHLSHLSLFKPLPGHAYCPSLIDKDVNMNESLTVFRCNFKGLCWSSFLQCSLFLWDYWGSVCVSLFSDNNQFLSGCFVSLQLTVWLSTDLRGHRSSWFT